MGENRPESHEVEGNLAPLVGPEQGREVDAITMAAVLYQELFKKMIRPHSPEGMKTKTRMDLVMALYIHGPLSMSALSVKTCIAPEQVTRTVSALCEDGLVSRERDSENRRSVVAALTDKGRDMLYRHRDGVAHDVLSYLDTLSDADRAALVSAAETSAHILHTNGGFGPIAASRAR